jgi:hypothetical protein
MPPAASTDSENPHLLYVGDESEARSATTAPPSGAAFGPVPPPDHAGEFNTFSASSLSLFQLRDVVQCLSALPSDFYDDRQKCLEVGFALKGIFGLSKMGLHLFEHFAKQSPKY